MFASTKPGGSLHERGTLNPSHCVRVAWPHHGRKLSIRVPAQAVTPHAVPALAANVASDPLFDNNLGFPGLVNSAVDSNDGTRKGDVVCR
jgi:hypothetical protein